MPAINWKCGLMSDPISESKRRIKELIINGRGREPPLSGKFAQYRCTKVAGHAILVPTVHAIQQHLRVAESRYLQPGRAPTCANVAKMIQLISAPASSGTEVADPQILTMPVCWITWATKMMRRRLRVIVHVYAGSKIMLCTTKRECPRVRKWNSTPRNRNSVEIVMWSKSTLHH